MSEQKYYVKLKKEFQATGVTFADMRLYLDENGAFDLKYFAHPFTKSELAEIMDGALYKQFPSFPFSGFYGRDKELNDKYNWSYNFEIECWEWKNPLIELVPVEEDE